MRPTIILLGLVAGAATLSGCTPRVKAPSDIGVCYFIGHVKGADGKPALKFNPIARDQPDIEHCAVQLYNARMNMLATNTAGSETEGAYQGSFLFVSNKAVDYSEHYEGPTFPLLVKAPDNRLVAPGSVVIEDAPDPDAPRTVEVPKDLPKTGATITQNPADEKQLAKDTTVAAKKP